MTDRAEHVPTSALSCALADITPRTAIAGTSAYLPWSRGSSDDGSVHALPAEGQ